MNYVTKYDIQIFKHYLYREEVIIVVIAESSWVQVQYINIP
jgi:hypothetical protein